MPDTLITPGPRDTLITAPAPQVRVRISPAMITWTLLALTQLMLFTASLTVNLGSAALLGQNQPLPAAWLPAWAISGGVHGLSVLAVVGLLRRDTPFWYSPLMSSLSMLLAAYNLTGALVFTSGA